MWQSYRIKDINKYIIGVIFPSILIISTAYINPFEWGGGETECGMQHSILSLWTELLDPPMFRANWDQCSDHDDSWGSSIRLNSASGKLAGPYIVTSIATIYFKWNICNMFNPALCLQSLVVGEKMPRIAFDFHSSVEQKTLNPVQWNIDASGWPWPSADIGLISAPLRKVILAQECELYRRAPKFQHQSVCDSLGRVVIRIEVSSVELYLRYLV